MLNLVCSISDYPAVVRVDEVVLVELRLEVVLGIFLATILDVICSIIAVNCLALLVDVSLLSERTTVLVIGVNLAD